MRASGWRTLSTRVRISSSQSPPFMPMLRSATARSVSAPSAATAARLPESGSGKTERELLPRDHVRDDVVQRSSRPIADHALELPNVRHPAHHVLETRTVGFVVRELP